VWSLIGGKGGGERGKGKGREGLSECGKASCTRSSRALSIRHAERLEFASRARVLPIDNSLARNLKFSPNFPRNQPQNSYQLLAPERRGEAQTLRPEGVALIIDSFISWHSLRQATTPREISGEL